jgi:hypothetical protein
MAIRNQNEEKIGGKKIFFVYCGKIKYRMEASFRSWTQNQISKEPILGWIRIHT